MSSEWCFPTGSSFRATTERKVGGESSRSRRLPNSSEEERAKIIAFSPLEEEEPR